VGSSHPASSTAEALASTKHLQSEDDSESIVTPSLECPLLTSLLSFVQDFPSTSYISCIREYNPTGLLQEDVKAAMGVIDRLGMWFSDFATVFYLAGNAGLIKKLGHCFGALLSAIDKLTGSSTSDPSHPGVAEFTTCTSYKGFFLTLC